MNLRAYLNVAEKAALAGGEIMLRKSRNLDRLNIYEKAQNDFVSDADLACEQVIIEHIQKAYPDHAILSEEHGRDGADDAPYLWVIDPLDGTTNFLHGFPFYAASVALLHKGTPVVGVVFDPNRNEMFSAAQGQGAMLNQRKIRVSQKKEINKAFIGTGIPYQHNQDINVYVKTLHGLISDSASIRRAGAASLDLAYVAAGRLDGFWEFGLKIWDIAAGAVIVQESGGIIGDLNGGFKHLESGNTLAANSTLFKALLKKIQNGDTR